jgi:hypothetical protein
MRLSSALTISAEAAIGAAAIGAAAIGAAAIGAGLAPATASAAVSGAAARSIGQYYRADSRQAASSPTTVTFMVTAGALTITEPSAACLGANAPCGATGATGTGLPGTTVTGLAGTTTVSDNRANLVATWTATASESDWADTTPGDTGAAAIPAAATSYTPGAVTVTGTITTTPSAVTLSNAAQTVVAGTAGVASNSATWNPTISLAIPTSAVIGLYSGTLTQSVS